jgi:endothelin-converting enzyme/putative endopeptidase
MSLITNKIGYPDKWRDYSALTLGTSHLENGMAWRSWEIKRHLGKIDQAPDRGEWFMPASMVNAYYNPTMNEIAFPAGILQPPFFGADRPSALNFGGIGMVVGHEITHGFDDDGRKFDGKGVMTDWWEPEVVGKFEESAQCVEDLYNGYPMLDDLHVDGELTLGENIADLGGLKQAYRAWKKAHGTEPQAIEGLTNDQLYFLGFAQGWCQVQSPEYSAMLLQVDAHSPAKWRVNGAVSQVAEFAEVFSCDAGKPLNPPQRCEVW